MEVEKSKSDENNEKAKDELRDFGGGGDQGVNEKRKEWGRDRGA
jgi:hypothetical protein